ncbi:zinc ABC transporter substrate-binding protein [Desulfovibrio sp. OttesenSCG-928-G15]|nr:zinc ABC transporter substrate-binding protein [Desulfovibrio sp. OttesenSCG-928-G15]
MLVFTAACALPFFPTPCFSAQPLPVLVSIAPQKFILEQIAKDAVQVTTLVEPGMDPHSYEPSPSKIRAAQEAGLWFTIGVPFEDIWVPRITGAAENLHTVSFIKGITRLKMHEEELLSRPSLAPAPGALSSADAAPAVHDGEENHPEHTPGHHEQEGGHHGHGEGNGEDPHVWLSPMLVRQMLPGIARELAKRLPEKAAEFRANARLFADELEKLDKELAVMFAETPQEKRVFLTFHPSWQYYAFNYQLTELTIEADGKEPGPQALQHIVDLAKRHAIRRIFVEPQFPKSAARAVAEVIAADIVVMDPLAEDIMDTYRSMAAKLVTSFKD